MTDESGSYRRSNQAIRSMSFRNLRAFRDTGELDIAPTNFLFGKNSSGKTTVLRAPLFFKQLVQQRTITGEAPLVGHYVDFGSYAEAVYNGEKSRDISISITLGLNARRILRDVVGKDNPIIESNSFTVTFTLHWNASRKHIQYNSITFSNIRGVVILQLTRTGPNRYRVELPDIGWSEVIEDETELSFTSLSLGLLRLPVLRSATLAKGGEVARRVEIYSYEFFRTVLQATEEIIHIGPLRDMPERAYRLDRVATPSTATQHVIGLLVNSSEATHTVSEAMRDLGVARQIELTSPAPGYAGLTVRDIVSGRRDNLADVGFGISQVLPIIAQLATAKRGNLVLIEQPELHLHPETQGRLADVMLRLAGQREVTLFIESHSESMLLRLRRRIAERSLDSNDLNVYVTNAGEVRKAAVDQNGGMDMSAFPNDFFEEDWIDAVGIARAARAN